VVLRGQAFRTGGQHSRRSAESGSTQWRALRSVPSRVLLPAARSGWACTVLVDVVASERHSAALRARAVHELRAAAVRVTSQLRASQMLSIAYTLQWALSHHLGEGGAASSSSSELDAQPGEQRGRTEDIRSWSCLLLLRADLEVKALPLPHPAALGCRLRVPFETLDGRGVADAAQLVPWCRFGAFFAAVARRAAQVHPKPCGERSVRCFGSDHLHSLCELLPDVAYLTPLRYDSNSAKDRNPVYAMVGRPQRAAGAVEEELHRRGLPGRPRSTGRVIGFSQPRGSAAKPIRCRTSASPDRGCERGCPSRKTQSVWRALALASERAGTTSALFELGAALAGP